MTSFVVSFMSFMSFRFMSCHVVSFIHLLGRFSAEELRKATGEEDILLQILCVCFPGGAGFLRSVFVVRAKVTKQASEHELGSSSSTMNQGFPCIILYI